MAKNKYDILKYKSDIVSLVLDGESKKYISEYLSERIGEHVSVDIVYHFMKKHDIEYGSNKKKRRVLTSYAEQRGTPCMYCNCKVINHTEHYSKCYRKKYHDELLPFKEQIIEYIRLGYGILSIPELLKLDTTRSRIVGFCKREGISFKNAGSTNWKQMGENNVSCRNDVKRKKEEGCLEKYGVRNVFQLSSVISKSQATKLDRYGCLNGSSRSATHLTKPHKFLSDYLYSIGVPHVNEYTKLNCSNEKYRPRPDIFLTEFGVIIEMYGDYWHANPSMYESNTEFCCFTGRKSAAEIWEDDKKRIDIFTGLGYDAYVIWESDLKDGTYKDKVNEILSNCKNRRNIV